MWTFLKQLESETHSSQIAEKVIYFVAARVREFTVEQKLLATVFRD